MNSFKEQQQQQQQGESTTAVLVVLTSILLCIYDSSSTTENLTQIVRFVAGTCHLSGSSPSAIYSFTSHTNKQQKAASITDQAKYAIPGTWYLVCFLPIILLTIYQVARMCTAKSTDTRTYGESINNNNPLRTVVPFWGQATWNLNDLSPKGDCGY